MLPRVLLHPKRARPFIGRHPWVFAGAIAGIEGDPADGDVVDLIGHAGSFIARGIYNSQSKIRVRLYCWNAEQALDRDFFRERLTSAIALRKRLELIGPGKGCRLVFSEGDGLSGLTIDAYDSWLVMQFTSLGLGQRKEMFADLLDELIQPKGIYVRTEKGIGQLEGLAIQDGPLRGELPTEALTIDEYGLRMQVNLAEGQKTGYYLDQRDNRAEVAKLAKGQRVLDAFCYSGGFGLHAARGGASEVICVDGSEAALHLARENARINGLSNMTFHKADIFEDLAERVKRGEKFGVVVLDPPRFARNRGSVEEALRGYRRLQTLGLQLLQRDGILATCCCTGLITMTILEELLAQVATDVRLDVQILQRRGPSADHPVSVSCLESHYLKCLITRVR